MLMPHSRPPAGNRGGVRRSILITDLVGRCLVKPHTEMIIFGLDVRFYDITEGPH